MSELTPGPESIGEPLAAFESSWARELQELKALAATDPDAALARVARMPERHEQKSATEAVCLVIAANQPAKAMTAAWNLGIGLFVDASTEGVTLETLASRWAEADLVKTFNWASALPADDEGRRDHVIKGIASTIAQVAPAEAARLVAQHINADSSVQVEAVMQVLRDWASQEYSAAFAWTSRLEGPLRERGLEELASLPLAQSQPKRD